MRAILVLLLVLIALPLASADDVQVSLYLLNLGKYDVGTGLFTADFYLQFTCETNCSAENFEFSNGRAASIDKIIDTPTEKFYRIQANLNSPPDLRRFPFDTQHMQIIIEDKRATIDELNYVSNSEGSGIESSNQFIGWNLDSWNANVSSHYYGVYNETYSQYKFNIAVSRIPMNSFLKTFLPIIFILMVALASFIIDPDKLPIRLTMVSSGLIASVMYHISISNQIPPVGYLTFADKFMILTYFVILSSFILNIAMFQLQEMKKHHHVAKLHKLTEYGMFIIVPMLYLGLFLLFGSNIL